MIGKLIELNNWFLALEATNSQIAYWIIILIILIVLTVLLLLLLAIKKDVMKKYNKKPLVQICFIVTQILFSFMAWVIIIEGVLEVVTLYFPTLSETLKLFFVMVFSITILLLVVIQIMDKNTVIGHYIKIHTDTNIEKMLKIDSIAYGMVVQALFYIILFIGIPLVLSIATVHAPNSKIKEVLSTFVEYLGIIILPVSLFLWARWESKNREDIKQSENEYKNLDIFVQKKIIPQLDKLEDENDYSKKHKTLNSIWVELTNYKRTSKVSKRIRRYNTEIQNVLDLHKNRTDSILDRIIEDTRNIADITETNRSLRLYLGVIEYCIKAEKEKQLKEQEQKKDK